MSKRMKFSNNTVIDSTINNTQQTSSAEQMASPNMATNQNMTNEGNTYINSPVYNMQGTNSTQQVDPPTLFGNFPLSKTIVGRDEDVRDLLRMVEKCHKVVITGIGGIGKTTLASLCANRWVNDEHFKHAVLINAEADVSVKNDFQTLAKKIFQTTDKTSTEIYKHYNTLEGQTIFVLDNIETSYNINKYLPHENLTNIYVLGTSQYTELRRIFHVYALDKLSFDSSVDMVRKVLLSNKEPINIDETETNLITDLAKKLDCHPLALEHAAAYIVDCILYNEMSVLTSVEHYIKTLSERLEDEPPHEDSTEYRRPVHTALEMNIAKATSKSEDARKLLACISYLDPTGIDIEMFYEHPAFNRERIKVPIRKLKKYSIISQHGRYITLHRLIQTVYRSLIEKENTTNNYMLDLLNVLFYFYDIWEFDYIRRHCSYLIQNLSIDKKAMATSYITAFRNNGAIVKRLTATLELINCNMEDIKDWPVLHYCVFAGHKTFYKYFNTSEHGSGDDRPERYASDTLTMLHVAIIASSDIYLFPYENKLDLIYFIKRNENQKNKTSIKGLTTLNLCAAFNVDEEDCSKLIEMGCDVNIPDGRGMTPILYAARNVAYKLVFRLHKAGATYDQSYKELLSAASDGDHESVLALLRASDIDCAASDFSKTLLHWAVTEGYCDLALELIGRHTDINVADSDGDTPLLWAAYEGHSEIVAALLDHGANMELADSDSRTPLLMAAWRGHSKIVAALLDRGANTEVTDRYGYTPLMYAAWCGRSEVVAVLLKRGANIDAKTKRGETALSYAVSNGHSTIVELLNEHKARTGGEPS